MINFDANKQDQDTIQLIVERAERLIGQERVNRLSLTMDITACHLNGCPLRLQDILQADDFNFIHDVGGISRHIDRTTGKLLDCFLPRFSSSSQDVRITDHPRTVEGVIARRNKRRAA